ncbi:MAG: DUF2752 domain-containing protein [Leptospiraceae bacterium]|nr:DUF2752 domain-containing protein [Leptospiraceae bacterium]
MIKLFQLISLFVIPILILLHIPNNAFTICPFFHLTDLPCPACGLGRSLIHIYHLDLMAALYFNPFGYVLVFLQWYLIVSLFIPRFLTLAVKHYKPLKFLGASLIVSFLSFGLMRILLFLNNFPTYVQYFYDFRR